MKILSLKSILTFLILITFSTTKTNAQCIVGNCNEGIGTYQYSGGSLYIGEWKDGKQNGQGKYIFKNNDIYEGQYFDGHKNGQGKYTFNNGGYYEGGFKNEVYDGVGKLYTSNGTIFLGIFHNDTLNGIISILFRSGDKYEGECINYVMNGEGKYYFAGGDRYEGHFKDGEFDGSGIEYFAKGGTLKGTWRNGKFISGSNTADKNGIKLIETGGVYEVPVIINGVLKFNLIFDTGASDLYLDPATVLTLIRTKTISDEDILEGGLYKTANGEVNKSVRFNIRKLEIGGYTINDIPAGVSNTNNSMNLLGLSALKKFGKIEINFEKNELHIYR